MTEIINAGDKLVNRWMFPCNDGYCLIDTGFEKSYGKFKEKLKELNLGDVLVVLIERGDETIIPRGDVLLQQGDVLVLSGETYHGDADTVLDELTIEPGDSRIGRRVRDIRGLENSLIVLIRRKDGNTVVPRGDARIQEGDVLVMNAS